MTTAPVGDLDNWRQVFVENFDIDVPLGSFPDAVSAKWSAYQDGWPDSTGHGTYMPSKTVSISDGILNVHVHTENGVHMVAALAPKFASPYGRYALRWRCDKMHGYKIVGILLWPNTDPGSPNKLGEIDGAELNCDSTKVGHFLHRRWVNDVKPAQGYAFVDADPTLWHTSVVEWAPNLVVFYFDGIEVYRNDVQIPNVRMHWIIQIETAMGGAPPPADDVEGNVQIDWVAGWKYDTTAKAPVAPRQLHIIAPATATGWVTVGATSSPDVTQVKWMMDGVEFASDSTQPWGARLDSTRYTNGIHRVSVKGKGAFWFEGNGQVITITNPWDIVVPATCTGVVQLSIDHQYPWIKQVKWVLDGVEIASDSVAPFTRQWDTTKVANGSHTIFAKLTGGDGWTSSPTHSITVAN